MRPSKAETIRRLRSLGDEDVSGPEPEFVARLERRLRSGGAAAGMKADAEPAAEGRIVPLRRSLTITGAVVAVAAAIVIAAVLMPSRSARTTLVLGRATDTLVIQPDGRVADARPGTVLPDGAIIRTGPAGQTTADGAEIGPNTEAIAIAGHLRPVALDRRLLDDGVAGRSPTMQLSAHRSGESAVVLHWTRAGNAGVYGYLILEVAGVGSPDFARDAVGFTSGTAVVDRRAPADAATFRIVAVDRQGRVLAVSQPATVGRS